MGRGKTIYLSKKEAEALLATLGEWEEVQSEEDYAWRLQNGLGTAWRKISECIEKTKKRG